MYVFILAICFLLAGTSYCESELTFDSTDNESEGEPDSDFQDASAECLTSDEDDSNYFEFLQDQTSREEPLHSGAESSHSEFMLALLTFSLVHQLSKRCLNDLLALLKLILPAGSQLATSAFTFFKYFKFYKNASSQQFFYCSFCRGSLQSKDDVCARCGPGQKVNSFIHLSIIDQLKQLFLKPGFYENLSYPERREKTNEHSYEDIYDGAIYKEAMRFHIGYGKWLTFMWNTDGFSLFKSSTFQVWPLYLTINELPPHLRFRRDNMLLVGLWFGLEKPDVNLFLKPIYDELCLLKKGFKVYVPSHGHMEYKAALLCGTCDAPAKALFMRHKYFNGKFGCPKCLCRGEKSVRTSNVFVYPYEENLDLRTDRRHLAHLRGVRRTGKVQFGVKGPSYLQPMLLISFVRSTGIDIMHDVFLGVMKSLMTLWFGEKHKGKDFSLYHVGGVVSAFLLSIKPPHFFQRIPQPISKLAFWKASEFKAFFFYYSLAVLYPVMDQVYFNHFKLLVLGVSLLCKDSVSEADIALSQNLLDEFVRRYEQLYGLRHMTFNVHLLRHLPGAVRELGPLWTSTCFMFEDMNGALKQLVHGSQYVGLQIVSTFELLTRLPVFISELSPGKVKEFCTRMSSPFARLNVCEHLKHGLVAVGGYYKAVPLSQLVQPLASSIIGNILYFKKLASPSFYYECISLNDLQRKKSSSHVGYIHNGIYCHGILHIFIRVSHCHCTDASCRCDAEYYAFIQRLDCTPAFSTLFPNIQIFSILSVKETQLIDRVNLKDIVSVCVKMKIDAAQYVADFVNKQDLQ